MGLSNFPSAAEGVLPVLVLNTVISVAFLKNMMTSLLQATWNTTFTSTASSSSSSSSSSVEIDESDESRKYARERRISVTKFKSLWHHRHSVFSAAGYNNMSVVELECCVCISGFEADEEVSELSCKHFFHKGCLDKWLNNNNHRTCPLCRSVH